MRTLVQISVFLMAMAFCGCKNDCQRRCEQSFDQAAKDCKAQVAASKAQMAGVPGVEAAASSVAAGCESAAQQMKASCESACR